MDFIDKLKKLLSDDVPQMGTMTQGQQPQPQMGGQPLQRPSMEMTPEKMAEILGSSNQ